MPELLLELEHRATVANMAYALKCAAAQLSRGKHFPEMYDALHSDLTLCMCLSVLSGFVDVADLTQEAA